MKLILVLLVAVVLFYMYYGIGTSSKDGKSVTSGVVSYDNETVGSLQVNGVVTLDGTTVSNALAVSGSLQAKKAHINTMQVNGHASLTECVVDGKAQIQGYLSAHQTKFGSELTLSTYKVKFDNCTLGALVIKKAFWALGEQVVELADNTTCTGPITFENGNGKVILSGNSQFNGSVQGAEVEKQ